MCQYLMMHYLNFILFFIATAVVTLVVIATAIVAPFNILNIVLLDVFFFFNVALINVARI